MVVTHGELKNQKTMKDKFKLIKPFGEHKKGKTYESFGGLVRGIYCEKTNQKVNFDNEKYFKLI